ncbi:AI-2E family transporter [Confluentibacter flavum]|uniref:AI-2E family transporter n=1 Tax=Confluentibacter flavum TaxID=1909700 RepID=A0A2N3HMG7_9FLAO|nr:AI-2E family transporter [Confluentibacter flavum]PKQ46153.1 AI-2E family transporter [Confluentibacter flavum]
MNSKTIASGILRALSIIIGVAILLFFLYAIRSVLAYLAISAVISLIGRPIVLFLRRRLKFKDTLAVVVTMALMIVVFLGIMSLFIPLVIEQINNLSLLNIDELQKNLEDLYMQIINYFQLNDLDVKQSFKDYNLISKIDYSLIPAFFNSVINGFGNFTVGFFAVLFISFFFLKDSQLFENGILMFIPDSKEIRWKNSSTKIKDLLSRYFNGLILQIVILFILYTIVLVIFGIKNAIIIAFLCALLNLIPYVGPLISFALIIILTMTSNLGASFSEVIFPKTIYVVIGFLIAQFIDNTFSQPIIFSKSVKSHPLEIFLIIIIAGILFGIIGMMVAVPGYTAIKVILKEFLSENKIVKKLTKDL